MHKCLIITFSVLSQDDFLRGFIQKNAAKFGLEGTAQFIEDGLVKIHACGAKDEVDNFLDLLHKSAAEKGLEDIEIEPFMKDRDFRGIFRVIGEE
ncbi:MAG: hypothetical protein UR26_C0007G0014 [candidate division TM6 bacterium GW2011_GWF2_32_72]|nr:MAG: hypothetical protein UR26_C0007G0014 [candidate division TM6 bacterium GW2011_GWF2_32_72]